MAYNPYDQFDSSAGNPYDKFDPPATKIPRTIGDTVGAIPGDVAGSLITGAVAAPISGIAGIAGSVLRGPQGQGADWIRKVQDALTLSPQTKAGSVVTDIVTKPLQWLEAGAHKAGEVTSDKFGPAAGAAVNTAIQMAPAAASKLFGGKVREGLDTAASERAKLQSQDSIKNASLNEGREAGYVVPPDSILRGLAGKAALRQETIQRNQPVTDSLARKAIELPDDVAISPSVLRTQREKFAAPYREIEQLSNQHPLFQPPFKGPKETLKEIGELRNEASSYFRVNRERPGGSPPALKRAERADARADFLEQSLEQTAEAMGRPDLIPRMREARTKLAKTYDVERALNTGDGSIAAHVIGDMYDKNPGKFTGELATIGKFDQAFRRYTGEASRMEKPGGTSLPMHSAALGAAIGGGAGWFPAGVALAGGPIRSLLLSDVYQKPTSYAPSTLQNVLAGAFSENAPVGMGALQAIIAQQRK